MAALSSPCRRSAGRLFAQFDPLPFGFHRVDAGLGGFDPARGQALLDGAEAGDLSKWMAVPWQTDTASCLSGYPFFNTSPSLPTFWPARVPNQVLRKVDYDIVMDVTKSNAERLAAFCGRADWFRGFPGGQLSDIQQMIREFHKLGIIEERPGPDDVRGIPARIWVESTPDLPDPASTMPGLATSAQATPTQFAGRKLRQIGQYGRTS